MRTSIKIVGYLCLAIFTASLGNTQPTPDADLNNDGFVDNSDLILFQKSWHTGERYTPTPSTNNLIANRILPENYQPLKAFTVSINLFIEGTIDAFAIEEAPPTGWTVSNISDGGEFDAINGKVKWFFLSGFPSTLTYNITPSDGASGDANFYGMATYTVDLQVVPVTIVGDLIISDEQPSHTPTSTAVPPPVTPTSTPISTALTASRNLPTTYTPEVSIAVSIDISIPGAFSLDALALEDSPPAGWSVDNVSDGGEYDAINHKVKWFWFSNYPTQVSYETTPPAGQSGVKTFDGMLTYTADLQVYPVTVGGYSNISSISKLTNLSSQSLLLLDDPHPVDADQNWEIDVSEILLFAGHWKRGDPGYDVGGLLIGAALWKKGGYYESDGEGGYRPRNPVTPTATNSPILPTSMPTNTPTGTNTPVLPTATATRTYTSVPTTTHTPGPTVKVYGYTYYAGTTITVSGVLVSLGDKTYTTGGDGYFELNGITSGEKTITASKLNYDPYSRTILVESSDFNLDIEMTSDIYTHSLNGTVTNILGNNVSGVTVRILNPDNTLSELFDTTDSLGHYQVASVPQGNRKIRFERNLYQTTDQPVYIYNADKTFNWQLVASVLPPPEGLTVTPGSGNWFDLAWIQRTEVTAKSYKIYRSNDPESGFSVKATGIKGSSYKDSAVVPGTQYCYRISTVNIDDIEGTQSDSVCSSLPTPTPTLTPTITPTPIPTTSVSGFVYYTNSTIPISNVNVSIAGKSTESEADGRYVIDGVTVGSHTLVAELTFYESFEENVSVPPSGLNYDIEMTSNYYTHTVSGYITDASDGYPLSNVTVTLLNPDDSYSGLKTTSSGSGSYSLVNVPEGLQEIYVWYQGPTHAIWYNTLQVTVPHNNYTFNIELDITPQGLPSISTGQTQSYEEGDDGYYQRGLARSFTVNSNGTFTDNNTGLVWIQNQHDVVGETSSWNEAVNICEDLEFAGYSDC